MGAPTGRQGAWKGLQKRPGGIYPKKFFGAPMGAPTGRQGAWKGLPRRSGGAAALTRLNGIIWGSALQDTNGTIKGCDPVVGGVQTPTTLLERAFTFDIQGNLSMQTK